MQGSRFESKTVVKAVTFASFTVATLVSLATTAAVGQNPFNDNQQWAQPPGAFLNNKAAAKKPTTTAKKSVAKLAPLKQNVQHANPPILSNQSNQINQIQQGQQPVGQSDWQQMDGTGGDQQQSSQQGASDWVGQTDNFNNTQNQGKNGQGWVTNTQAPADYGQSGSSSASSGLGSSGWITPGGAAGGTGGDTGSASSGSMGDNTGGQRQSNGGGAFSSQGVGNFQPQPVQQMQQGNVQQSQWTMPNSNSPNNNSNNGIGQSQWNTPGGAINNSNNLNDNNPASQASSPGFPPSSFSPGSQQGSNQPPLLGDVLAREQMSGSAQATGVSRANMNMGGGGQAMPAFSQGSAAGFMPGLMNLMQNIMPAKGGGFNPNLNTGTSSGGGAATGTVGSGNGNGVFVQQQQPQRRQTVHRPLQTPRIITQTGRQVSRQLNRSVNNMLYRGIGNLRF